MLRTHRKKKNRKIEFGDLDVLIKVDKYLRKIKPVEKKVNNNKSLKSKTRLNQKMIAYEK